MNGSKSKQAVVVVERSQTSHLKLNLVQFPTMINGEDRWEQCIRHLFFLTFPPPQVSQRTKGVTLPLPDADDAKMRRSRRCIFGTNDERASEHHVQVPTDTVSIIITERPKQTLRNLQKSMTICPYAPFVRLSACLRLMSRGDRLQTATERRPAKWRVGKRRRDTHTAERRRAAPRNKLWYFRAFHHSRTPFTETMLELRQRSTNAESMRDTVVNRAGLLHLLVPFHWLLSRATVFVEVLMDLLSHVQYSSK